MRIYKTIKGASIRNAQGRKPKKKNKQGRKLSLYIQGGEGVRGGAMLSPIYKQFYLVFYYLFYYLF